MDSSQDPESRHVECWHGNRDGIPIRWVDEKNWNIWDPGREKEKNKIIKEKRNRIVNGGNNSG